MGFGPAVKRLTGRLHGVSGMFLLNPEFSSALRFFLEIRPVDMNAAGRGFTSLKLSGVANVSAVSSRAIRLTGAGRVAPAGRDLEKLNIGRRPSGL